MSWNVLFNETFVSTKQSKLQHEDLLFALLIFNETVWLALTDCIRNGGIVQIVFEFTA